MDLAVNALRILQRWSFGPAIIERWLVLTISDRTENLSRQYWQNIETGFPPSVTTISHGLPSLQWDWKVRGLRFISYHCMIRYGPCMDQVCTCSEFTYQAAGQIAASYGTSASRSCLCDALVWPRSKKSLRRQSFSKKSNSSQQFNKNIRCVPLARNESASVKTVI